MGSTIVTALDGFETSLTQVANAVLPVAAAGLLVWIGWRLACKLANRGVGK